MHRISLANTAFEGNNNAYLIESDGTVALIDTGDSTDETREQLEAGLAEHGHSFSDIDLILLTHFHGDHTGLAATIQDISGAIVYAHEADAALIGQERAVQEEMQALQVGYFDEWGIPDNKQAVLRSVMHGDNALYGNGPDVDQFVDGDTFDIGEHRVTARHTPGHAAGLSSFELSVNGKNIVASGDALLPVYTPNVGGADVRVDNALAKYLDTLQWYIEADYDRAWPGHRDPIEDPAARAADIIHHHEERAWRVLNVLREYDGATPWEVSAHLFGELESIHILHGPGEAYAHLDHLARENTVERNGRKYRITDAAHSKVDKFEEEERWPLVESITKVEQ